VAPHFFTDARLRLREDPDEWDLVARFAGVPTGQLRLLHQVHGNCVVEASALQSRPEADAIISDDPSVALVVRVADCAPLLIADARLGVVAAVHAGWRGTLQRIAPVAVRALADRFGSRPEDLIVAIGPSLGACCGEMGAEVVDAFAAAGHDRRSIERWFTTGSRGRPHFDLWRANADQLETAGVAPNAIHVAELCTRTYPDAFHSYRAAGSAAGRMAAVIRANR
jgi:YfiH family protein